MSKRRAAAPERQSTPGLGAPPRRPNARVRKVPLIEREVRERIGAAALEVLFARAEIVVEGRVADGAFGGTVLIAAELSEARGALRDPCDAVSARRVAAMAAADEGVRARALVAARRALEEKLGHPLGELHADVSARAEGTRLHLDVDVEVAVGGDGPAS